VIELDLALARGDFALEVRAELGDGLTGVFGHSGAGKSTLLHLLAGLLRPDRGLVRVGGRTLCDVARGVFVPPHRREVAVVFQDGRLFPHLSVERNLAYGRRGERARRLDWSEVVERMALGALLDRPARELSGGERQRVALARAILSGPRLILFDEPLTGLDPELRAQVLPFLRRVRELCDVPALYVSHALGEVLQLTDRLLLLEGGRLRGSGTLLELVQRPELVRTILHDDLVNVLALRVLEHDREAGLTRLAAAPAPDGAAGAGREHRVELFGPLAESPPGSRVHLGLLPHDVMLARERVAAISARNQLCGTVRRVLAEGSRYLTVVDAGLELLVEVSPDALRELELEPGRRVWCLFKANALRYLDAAPSA